MVIDALFDNNRLNRQAIEESKKHKLGIITYNEILNANEYRGVACRISVLNGQSDLVGQLVGLYQRKGKAYYVIGDKIRGDVKIARDSIVLEGFKLDKLGSFSNPERDGYAISSILLTSEPKDHGYSQRVNNSVKNRFGLIAIYSIYQEEAAQLNAEFRYRANFDGVRAYAARSREDQVPRQLDFMVEGLCQSIEVKNVVFTSDWHSVVFIKTDDEQIQVQIADITALRKQVGD